jgi:hypothetical protein
MSKAKSRIQFPRHLLLVEIERRCSDSYCNARVMLGLTKEEAREYHGFKCERCELWSEDALTERDIPEWWEQLAITSLAGRKQGQAEQPYAPGEVTERLSAAYRKQVAGIQITTETNEFDGDERRAQRVSR